jgi:Ion channel
VDVTGLVGVIGLLIVVVVLVDAFETVVLPRRVNRRWRITVAVYRTSWPAYRAVARRVRNAQQREVVLSYYGPASLLLLFACWAGLLILGYALAIWAFASPLTGAAGRSFGTATYSAASTFFTLGFGDAVARRPGGRAIVVAAGGTGFAFLALVVSYLPTLYQAFSRREIYISQLDARAGSPPSAGELLARHGADGLGELGPFLNDWESWSADLLENVLSFPTLGYYRSHHDNQSWLAGLTVILDTCSLLLAGREDGPQRQARLTYAMCRHAAVDLAQVLQAKPASGEDRLDSEALDRLRARLADNGWQLPDGAIPHLAKLRAGYEPYVTGLSRRLLMPLPYWTAREGAIDSWQLTKLDERGRRPTSRRRGTRTVARRER